MSGTVNISRDLFDHGMFKAEPFTEREAWIWMIMAARWKSGKARVGDFVVDLARGEFAASVRFMARAWGWTAAKVQRLLERLKKMEMICVKTDTGVSVVTICNYGKFQTSSQTADTGPIQDRYKREEGSKKEIVVSSEGKPSLALLPKANRFSEFWDAYPHRGGAKKGRKPSEAKYAAALKAGVPEQDIIDGARRASQDRQVRAGFARDPTTWLNQAGWNDEIDTSTEMAKGQQNGHRPNERAAFDRSIIAVADGLTAGTIHLDNSSRDPFARKSG